MGSDDPPDSTLFKAALMASMAVPGGLLGLIGYALGLAVGPITVSILGPFLGPPLGSAFMILTFAAFVYIAFSVGLVGGVVAAIGAAVGYHQAGWLGVGAGILVGAAANAVMMVVISLGDDAPPLHWRSREPTVEAPGGSGTAEPSRASPVFGSTKTNAGSLEDVPEGIRTLLPASGLVFVSGAHPSPAVRYIVDVRGGTFEYSVDPAARSEADGPLPARLAAKLPADDLEEIVWLANRIWESERIPGGRATLAKPPAAVLVLVDGGVSKTVATDGRMLIFHDQSIFAPSEPLPGEVGDLLEELSDLCRALADTENP